MEILTVEQIKQHSRYDFDNQDPLVEAYGEKAESIIQMILGKTFNEIERMADGKLPIGIIQSCLILCSELFIYNKNNVPRVYRTIPKIIPLLLEPYATKGIVTRVNEVETKFL